MSRTIAVLYKHQLGVDRVKRLIDEKFAAIKASYIDKIGDARLVWIGDKAEIRTTALGQKVAADVAVAADDVAIKIELPWLLAGLSGTIESILRSNVEAIDTERANEPRVPHPEQPAPH